MPVEVFPESRQPSLTGENWSPVHINTNPLVWVPVEQWDYFSSHCLALMSRSHAGRNSSWDSTVKTLQPEIHWLKDATLPFSLLEMPNCPGMFPLPEGFLGFSVWNVAKTGKQAESMNQNRAQLPQNNLVDWWHLRVTESKGGIFFFSSKNQSC